MATGRIARAFGMGGIVFALGVIALPAAAQDAGEETRIRKLEGEVRALQRKVFPGGDERFFEPEITGQPATRPTVTTPSTTAVTDILARLDALEGQLQRLTAQSEEHGNAIRTISERLDAVETGARSNQAIDRNLETMTGTPPPATDPGARPQAAATRPATTIPASVTTRTAVTPSAATPSAERLAAVQAITKPQTTDGGDDEYTYGFRLWDAGFYPEAQQQLTMFLDKQPRHARASFARNLLGRAYLDDGKAKEAAPWFLQNYQTDKDGDRAGDSLLYLAEAMIALKDTQRACIALAEFSETYPALATGRLQRQYEANRGKVKCN